MDEDGGKIAGVEFWARVKDMLKKGVAKFLNKEESGGFWEKAGSRVKGILKSVDGLRLRDGYFVTDPFCYTA